MQWWYQPDNPFQQWYVYRDFSQPDPGSIQYRNARTGKCLAVRGAGDGHVGAQ